MGVGVKRIEVDPGRWSTPAHVEGSDEEIFFVLGGSGVSWQDDGTGPAAYRVSEGDCLVHLALAEAHTLRAGPEGLDVLAFGMRSYAAAATYLPRAGIAWLGDTWVLAGGDENHPYRREERAGEPPVGEPMLDRTPTIVALADVQAEEPGRGGSSFVQRNLGRAAGSQQSGLRHVEVRPGKMGWPPHCHAAEEELYVVLAGEGTLLLGDDEHAVRRGSVVARPAGTRVAHAFRAGDGGLAYLVYGTRVPNDVAYYPRSRKVFLRGVGVMTRVERLDYWDGEE